MSLTSLDLGTLSAVLVETDTAMEFCGISKYTRDAVRAAVMERIVELTLHADLKDLPKLMIEAAPEHIDGHPSRRFT